MSYLRVERLGRPHRGLVEGVSEALVAKQSRLNEFGDDSLLRGFASLSLKRWRAILFPDVVLLLPQYRD